MAEEKEKPLTCADVLRLIEENGGTARGLDLSNCQFVDGIDLSDLDLTGIILNNAGLFLANFNGSNLDIAAMQGARVQHATFNPSESRAASLQLVDLRNADLTNAEFREANLTAAKFQEEPGELSPAFLHGTDFRGANLFLTNFNGCYFYSTKLEGAYIRGADILEAHLEEADWGSYVIGEESKKEEVHFAESVYRRLKMWYTNAGMYDVAGEFFFREMTAQRKRIKWWPQPWHRAWSAFHSFVSGYGERPLRVVRWGALVLFGSALLYFLLRGVAPYNLSVQAFLNSLYYNSAVSFTALGYGPWFGDTSVHGWVQSVGAAEAFVGVFTIALFLVTFTRKMRR